MNVCKYNKFNEYNYLYVYFLNFKLKRKFFFIEKQIYRVFQEKSPCACTLLKFCA